MDNLQRIAQSLAKRALENGHDPTFYSPFARSAKRSLGINICGKIIRLFSIYYTKQQAIETEKVIINEQLIESKQR